MFPDLEGWRFIAAARTCGLNGPDTPPPEAGDDGLFYWFAPNRRTRARPAFTDEDIISGEEAEDFCRDFDIDPIDFFLAARRAEPEAPAR